MKALVIGYLVDYACVAGDLSGSQPRQIGSTEVLEPAPRQMIAPAT